jgi:hypothetical protein
MFQLYEVPSYPCLILPSLVMVIASLLTILKFSFPQLTSNVTLTVVLLVLSLLLATILNCAYPIELLLDCLPNLMSLHHFPTHLHSFPGPLIGVKCTAPFHFIISFISKTSFSDCHCHHISLSVAWPHHFGTVALSL